MSVLLLAWLVVAQAEEAAEVGPTTTEAAAPSEEATAVTGSLVLQVAQRDAAADAVVAEAERLGGWFQSRTSDHVALRVPVEAVDALLEVAASQGHVAQRALERQDLSREIADVRGRLEAREEVLARYDAVLADAGAKSVVAVERQIVDAIAQIEALRGRLRVLQDRARYARVDVAFRFRERAAPARDGSSSFPWLNTLNVQDVVSGMQAEHPGWRTRSVDVPTPPDGFSAWRNTRRYRAASPDGVLFRVRTERHRPSADLAFWREAARARMEAAGYEVVRDEAVEAGGVAGGLLELASPLGEEDWTYLVAFFPDGRHLVIAEAAGEVVRFDARREAVLAAVRGLEP